MIDPLTIHQGAFQHTVDVWNLRCIDKPEAAKDGTRAAHALHQTQGWLIGTGGEVILIARRGATAVGWLGMKPGRWIGTDLAMWQVFELFVIESERSAYGAGYRLARCALRILALMKIERFQVLTENRKLERFAERALGLGRVGVILEGGVHAGTVRRVASSDIGQEVHEASCR